MKWTVKSGLVVASVIGCLSATVSAQSVFARLGLAASDASEKVLSAIQDVAWPGVVAQKFLALSPGARTAVVTEVAAWAKAYYNSAAFKKAWADSREANKPDAPKAGSTDAGPAAKNTDQEKQVAELKKLAATLPPDQRASIEDGIKHLEAAAHDPAQQAQLAAMAEHGRAGEQKKYQDALKQWQQDYPVDPTALVARRLREFLVQTADVDFDATLVTREGTKYFANDQYEKKSPQWKMSYRAGREAATAARAAAAAWLKDLGR